MIAALVAQLQKRPAGAVALAILLGAAATIAGAWSFEALGYLPCELCLLGRKPYYLGMGVAALCVLLSARGREDLARKGLPALALIFLAGAGIAAYHAGVEWKFWSGPPECTGGTSARFPRGLPGAAETREAHPLRRAGAARLRPQPCGLECAALRGVLGTRGLGFLAKARVNGGWMQMAVDAPFYVFAVEAIAKQAARHSGPSFASKVSGSKRGITRTRPGGSRYLGRIGKASRQYWARIGAPQPCGAGKLETVTSDPGCI